MMIRRTVLLLTLALGVSPLRAACTSTFLAPTASDAGTRPGNVAAADFNLDGYVDLAIVNSQTTQLTVLLGSAGGTFTTALTVATEWTQNDIQAADVNKDGKPDIIVAIPWSENFTVHPYLKVLLGIGNGYFTPVAYTSQQQVYQNPDDMVLGDFDNDGWIDAATTKANGEWSSMKNLGGYFAARADYTTATGGAVASGIAKGDFDGDGKSDIAVSEIISKKIYLFFGKGDGTFTPGAATIDVPHADREPEDVEAGDFNGDGKDDLAILIRNPSGGPAIPPLKIALSNGAARTFGTPVEYGLGYSGYELLVKDVDGDGKPDVVVGDLFLGPLLYRGNGDGTVGAQQAFTNTAAWGMTFTDVDKDGGPDLIATNFYTGKVNLFMTSCGQATLGIVSSQNPSTQGTGITITATLTSPPGASATGTLTMKRDGDVLSSSSVSGTAGMTYSTSDLPLGTHTFSAEYSGDSRFAASTASLQQSVTPPPFGPPPNLNAISTGGPVQLSWSATQNTDHYEVWRNDGTGYVFAGNANSASFTDHGAPASSALLYKVRAVDAQGGFSAFSAADLATTYAYTDELLLAGITPMKLAHLTELRTAANATRSLAGLGPATWSDPSPSFVLTSHVTELRTAIDQARSALALPAFPYQDLTLTPGSTPIRASHIFQLRDAIR